MSLAVWLTRHWIPPGALVFALLSHGGSWLLLAAIAAHAADQSMTGPVLAWIHLVALGWFSMAALGILLHVIPSFTGVTWSYEAVARWSLAIFGAGVALFVLAWLMFPTLIAPGALVCVAALSAYLLVASLTLKKAADESPPERAIALALGLNLLIFGVVAVLGTLMAFAVDGWAPVAWLMRLPSAHASLGLCGWLTLLVFGVSARTVRPICGVRSRLKWVHALAGALVFGGSVSLALGLAADITIAIGAGAFAVLAGVALYIVDVAHILLRASVAHRAPQAFISAALVWLLIAVIADAGTLAGRPWQAVYVFVVLVGWVGQMANAHMFHIGVRLIATIFRGDDDETPPGELLGPRLSWATFAVFQVAIALCALGLATQRPELILAGALLGFFGWLTLLLNLDGACRRARRPPIQPRLTTT